MGGRYTVGELAKLAGVSARTLRHYEDEGLLVPEREANGYRVYSQRDAKRLAQIISMRSCGLSLANIRQILAGSNRGVYEALVAHLANLRGQMEALDEAAAKTQAAIDAIERIEPMDERKAFEAMKAEAVRLNEEEYGEEVRARYGDNAVDAANERLLALSEDEWNSKEQLEKAIKVRLSEMLAAQDADPRGQRAAELAAMHARWIQLHWGEGAYSREAHLGLAQGYLADQRFRDYYDSACGDGATELLVEALRAHI